MESCPVEPGFYFIKDFDAGERLMPYAVTETKIFIAVDIKTKANGKMVDLFNYKIQYEVKTLDNNNAVTTIAKVTSHVITFIVAKSFIVTTMKLETFLVIVFILIFVKCSDQAVKFLNCVILIDPMKIIVSKVEETHNKYMLDFKHSLRITQNFTNYISINVSLFVKLDSTLMPYAITKIKIVIVVDIKTKIKGEMVDLGNLTIHYEVEALEIVNIE
ncbi:CLUMA_CG001223, isoform A [Clunio marinus]|uniref:CLUMA_CG001223, isoform A n=1 Tax=Clunio marinus TaxID=568069 RepID=A0A1J1HHD9_9DIPT|nr:CLUMA_CG001223, isoform A [Clunio marinus]